MAPISNMMPRVEEVAAMPPQLMTSGTYPGAILMALFSLLIILLIIPPMCWHYRNHNVCATLLVLWTIIMNLQTLTNAWIWRNDDIANWYNGAELCDIQVKIQIAFGVAGPAALAGVLRALANAMDTNRTSLTKSQAQKWKDMAIDLSLCVGFPALQMLFHWIVQPTRYWIAGISGCVAVSDQTWLTVLLLFIPPIIWTLADGYFAILILARLFRYRLTFASVLGHANLTKTRFLRLYIFCALSILIFVPVQMYVLYTNMVQDRKPFHWQRVHAPERWNAIVMIPSHGRPLYQPYLWLGGGVVIFVFFGMGKDAMAMYRAFLLAARFDMIMPSLRPDYTGRNSITGSISTMSSKVKLLFKRKGSTKSWYTDSTASYTESATDPISPKNVSFLEAIKEESAGAKTARTRTTDLEKPASCAPKPPITARLASLFRSTEGTSGDVSLSHLSGQQMTVLAGVAARPPPSAVYEHEHDKTLEVIVRKEVRQKSETA